ncbi:hypothetical protein M8C21_012704, partial [Ambrosia artemisiifolia]
PQHNLPLHQLLLRGAASKQLFHILPPSSILSTPYDKSFILHHPRFLCYYHQQLKDLFDSLVRVV